MQTDSSQELSNDIFIANTVHEIRTPVQTIIGALDLLSDTALDNEQCEYVHQIRLSSDILLNLVNDILDLSKLKSNRMTIERIAFDIHELTERTVRLISIEAFAKNIEVITDIDYALPPLIMGDPIRTQQVLINLLKNAVKFTPRGYIHIELTRHTDEQLCFKITDSGIGIPQSKREKLFNTYYQADASTARKYGGTGLGLAICRAIVSAMGGEIGVDSNPYGGCIFWFTMPFRNPCAPTQKTYTLPLPAQTCILIVDDSPLTANSIKNMLNAAGLSHVQTSTHPGEALLKLVYAEKMGMPTNIVFIDMQMPVMDGWQLASEIKNTPALRNCTLYMLVPEGKMGSEAKMKCLDWFKGYLHKPVRFDSLRRMLYEAAAPSENMKTGASVAGQKPIPPLQTAAAAIPKGIPILVAEDHPVNRSILSAVLKKIGCTVFEAENGAAALERIREHPCVQMIFMDIQMPVMNGIEATEQLRNNRYSGIIIACTANNENNFFKYQKSGVNDILPKPFKRESVKLLLEKWLPVMELPSAPQSVRMTSEMVSDTELWDTADFEDTIGGDRALGEQILSDYAAQTAALISDVKDALAAKDFKRLDADAHTIKGSSAAVSAGRLQKIGDALGNAAKAGDSASLSEGIQEIEKQFELFLLQIGTWKQQGTRECS